MIGPTGNSEFCFPSTLNDSRGVSRGNKTQSIFPLGLVILKVLSIGTGIEYN